MRYPTPTPIDIEAGLEAAGGAYAKYLREHARRLKARTSAGMREASVHPGFSGGLHLGARTRGMDTGKSGIDTAEAALKGAQETFLEIFNSHPHGLAITTFDEGRYLFANQRESLLLGYAHEELIGRTALEMGFYHDPEDSRKIRDLLTRDGSVNNYKIKYHLKSGETRWGLISASLIEYAGQQCLLSSVTDCTQLHLAEEALRVSEERLRLASEGARVGMWDWDLRNGSIHCNDICFAILGYSREEFSLSFESWKDVILPDDREAVLKNVERVAAGKLVEFTGEYRVRRKKGDWRWVKDRGRVIEWNPDGTAARAMGILFDIQESKIFEIELANLNQELEKKIRERTASLEDLNKNLEREISVRRQTEVELQRRTEELAEINKTLRVVLRNNQEENFKNITKLATSIRELGFPYLEKLKRAGLSGKQAANLQLLEETLLAITAPAFRSLPELRRKLTHSEYQVAWFISQGKTSKQVSEVLGISCRTVESHRKSIRNKLALQNLKISLASFLRSIAEQDQ